MGSPITIRPGQAATLQWNVTGATNVSIEPGLGAVEIAGERQVKPAETITYTLVARGPGGESSETAFIEVRVPGGSGGGGGGRGGGGRQGGTEPVDDPVPSGPGSGTLIWEGNINGTELVTIDGSSASPGHLVSGRLPGFLILVQPQNEKNVAVASAPGPETRYRRLVLRVKGKGQTRVVINWSRP